MAAELEQLRQDVERLSKKFRAAGQEDFADQLDVDAENFGLKAEIARERGLESFAWAVSTKENSSPETAADILGYTHDQIANQPDQISQKTKVYVGSLVHYDKEGRIIPIFERLRGVERFYTAFPEGEIVTSELTIGGMNPIQLQKALKRGGFKVVPSVEDIMKSRDFKTLSKPETIRIVRLPVVAMCPDIEYPTTPQLYQRADDLGLKKCPAEVGPHLRLKDTDQQMDDIWYFVSINQISNRDGHLGAFQLGCSDVGLWLGGGWQSPVGRWGLYGFFVFAFR